MKLAESGGEGATTDAAPQLRYAPSRLRSSYYVSFVLRENPLYELSLLGFKQWR